MYEDLYPKQKKKAQVEDFEEYEVDIGPDGKARRKKKINLYPKGQTTNRRTRKISKKARDTMKRAMDIRKYIKEGEKDKE